MALVLVLPLFLIALGLAGCGRRQPLAPEADPGTTSARRVAPAYVDPAPGQAIHLTGVLGPGARYAVDKPANWNGALVVWVHGYGAPTDPIQVPNLGPLLPFFLSQGFAVAASSFSENGYAVAEGARQTHQLAQAFSDLVAKPDRTYLVGPSLGGIIGLKLLGTYDRQFDGALLVSGVVGGSDDEVRYLGDTWVLFDKFFPDAGLPALFEERPGPFPQAQLIGLLSDPNNSQRVQLFLAFARDRGLTFNSATEAVQATLTALGFTWIGALDFFDRAHEHVLFDNAQTVYTASGVPAAIVDDVNLTVERFASTPDARAYLRNYYEPDGDLPVPVITLHDQRDPLVPFFHEGLLNTTVASAGKSELLRQYSTDSFGHVSPAVQGQIPARFLELVSWTNSMSARKPAHVPQQGGLESPRLVAP